MPSIALARDLHSFGGDGVDVHRAIVLDVDFATGFFDDAFDVLATRPDQRADLLGIDLDRDDARSVLAHFLARLGNDFGHFAEDEQAGDCALSRPPRP